MFCGKCDFWIILLWKHEGKGCLAFCNFFRLLLELFQEQVDLIHLGLSISQVLLLKLLRSLRKLPLITNPDTKERKMPKQENQIQYESLRIRTWFSFVSWVFLFQFLVDLSAKLVSITDDSLIQFCLKICISYLQSKFLDDEGSFQNKLVWF